MTREDALDIFEDNFTVLNTHGHYTEAEEAEAITMAIKALEQEPILDKISAEIADIYCGQYCENPLTADAVREMALEIIDRYKAEGSDKE